MQRRKEERLRLHSVRIKSRNENIPVKVNVVAHSVAVIALRPACYYMHHLSCKEPVRIRQHPGGDP